MKIIGVCRMCIRSLVLLQHNKDGMENDSVLRPAGSVRRPAASFADPTSTVADGMADRRDVGPFPCAVFGVIATFRILGEVIDAIV
jgi:hypothetical protein